MSKKVFVVIDSRGNLVGVYTTKKNAEKATSNHQYMAKIKEVELNNSIHESNEEAIASFRILNKFRIINENIDCEKLSLLDSLIYAVNVSEGSAKIGAVFALKQNLEESYSSEFVTSLFEKLKGMNKIPKYDLSTYEGFIEAFVAEMSSGASFGGSLSGAGTNASINNTGLAGTDKPLKTKRKIDKILGKKL